MIIQAIALDDEPLALNVIKRFCEQTDTVNLIKCFESTDEARQFLENKQVDLLFLDINMPAISGIDFLRQVPIDSKVIFTTAYSEYALAGFELNAVDYLLKPFTFERFEKAIQKASQSISHNNESHKTLSVKVGYDWIRIPQQDISHIESLDNYIKIHLAEKQPILSRTAIKTIENVLPATDFIRTHRSFIVSKGYIIKLVKRNLLLKNGVSIPISKSHFQSVSKLFE